MKIPPQAYKRSHFNNNDDRMRYDPYYAICREWKSLNIKQREKFKLEAFVPLLRFILLVFKVDDIE